MRLCFYVDKTPFWGREGKNCVKLLLFSFLDSLEGTKSLRFYVYVHHHMNCQDGISEGSKRSFVGMRCIREPNTLSLVVGYFQSQIERRTNGSFSLFALSGPSFQSLVVGCF